MTQQERLYRSPTAQPDMAPANAQLQHIAALADAYAASARHRSASILRRDLINFAGLEALTAIARLELDRRPDPHMTTA